MLRPLPGGRPPEGFRADALLDAPLSVVTGPLGSYSAEALAWTIEQHGRWQDCVWVRPDVAHAAVVTELLVTACRRRWSAGAPDVAAMPGLAAPGPDADAALADVMRTAPAGAVVVLEVPDRVGSDVDQLLQHLRLAASDVGVSVVAVTERRVAGRLPRRPDRLIAASAMRRPTSPPPATGVLRCPACTGWRGSQIHSRRSSTTSSMRQRAGRRM